MPSPFIEKFINIQYSKLGSQYEHGFHILAGPNSMCLCGMVNDQPKFCIDYLRESYVELTEEIAREIEKMKVEEHDHGTEDVCCGIALGRNDQIEKTITLLVEEDKQEEKA